MAIGTASLSRLSTPLSPLSVDYMETRADGGYAWDVRYDLTFDGRAFTVETDIDLTGAAPGATQTVWETGIERIWNGQASLSDGIALYPLRFDVHFLDGGSTDYQVTVRSEYGRSDMLNWYLQTDWGPSYQDELAAHEYGHMIGMFDEYAGGATLAGATRSGTIMSDLSDAVSLDSFRGVDASAERLAGRSFTVVSATAPPPASTAPPPTTPTLTGTAGADTLTGGWRAEVLKGLAGNDSLNGKGGNDDIDGGSGDDRLLGDIGNDTLAGGIGADTLDGGDGDDLLKGGTGNDALSGAWGRDRLYGEDGADTLKGGGDNDVLDGGAGADWLAGGRGNDTLTGGAGADVFAFALDTGHDTVLDFHRAEGDRIALAADMTWTAATATDGTLLHFTGGGDALLHGVHLADVATDWFFTG